MGGILPDVAATSVVHAAVHTAPTVPGSPLVVFDCDGRRAARYH